MKKFPLAHQRALRSSFLIALLSNPVLELKAQDDQAELFLLPMEELLQVRVSVASLVEESALDVASSVSLLTSEEWRRSGAKRLSDALESVPSITSYTTFGGAEAIAIRGYGTELSVRGIANSLDGVPLNTFTFATSFYDKPIISLNLLDRVEVIRGPGSTLYGTDAFHGVLAYQTRSSDEDTVQVETSLGDPSYSASTFLASQDLGGVNLSVGLDRIRQGDRNLPYWYTSPYDGSINNAERGYQYENSSGFFALDGGDKNSGKWRVSAFFNDYESEDFPGPGQQFFVRLIPEYDILNGNIGLDRDHGDQNSDFALVQADYSVNLGSTITFDSQIYWWRSNQEWQFDNSRYPLTITERAGGVDPCSTSLIDVITTRNSLFCPHTLFQNADETRRGIQANLKGYSEQAATQWVAGLGWDTLKVDDSQFRRIAFDGTPYIEAENPTTGKVRDVGFAFAQANTELVSDKLNLVYGLRYDRYSDVGAHASPRAGLVYSVNDSYTSKLLYGHAYRAPTANERFGTFLVAVGNEDIEPETMDTYEWVNIFHSDHVYHELTLFYSEWKDGIILTPLPGSSTSQIYVNTGDNSSKGVELSSNLNMDLWRFSGDVSYVKSENKVSSQDYVAFPRWLLTLQAGYLFPEHNVEVSIKERVMRDYALGDVLGSFVPPDASNYYRTDVAVAKRLAGQNASNTLELALNIYNVFDRENVEPSVYNAESGLTDDGRTFLISARLSL